MSQSTTMIEYMFVRAEGFYFLSLRDDEDARRNAECNPGTIAVTECLTGKKVWPSAPSSDTHMSQEGICIGSRGDNGCGYTGRKSGDTCPECGGMILSQRSIDMADEAARQWDLSAKSGTSRTPTTSSSDSATPAPDAC